VGILVRSEKIRGPPWPRISAQESVHGRCGGGGVPPARSGFDGARLKRGRPDRNNRSRDP